MENVKHFHHGLNILNLNNIKFFQYNGFEYSFNKINFYKIKFILHSQNSFPVISDNVIEFKDNPNSEMKLIKIIRYSFKRLPKPYETQCYEYPTNETQFHCLNKCYEKSYQNHFQCIPKYNSLLTIRLYDDYIDPNVTFCSDFYINKENKFNYKLIKFCQTKCPVSCISDMFMHQIDNINIVSHDNKFL